MPEYLFPAKPQDRRRGPWRSILIVVVYVVIVSGIVIGSIYLYPIVCVRHEIVLDVCVTENCLKAAEHISSSLDTYQDPCYDFYQFTCGGFIHKAYEKNDPSYYYTQQLNIANKLNAIIAEPITGEEEGDYLQQKKFYQSCMDVNAIDQRGLESFKELLEEFGGWPIVEGPNWNEEDLDISEFIIKCLDLGLPFQWLFEVTYNDAWFGITPPNIKKQYNDTYKESAYLNLMIETAAALSGSRRPSVSQMETVLAFEKKLEMIATPNEQKLINFDELEDILDLRPWVLFINNVTDNYTLVEFHYFLVDEIYITKLNLLLAKTSKSVQANFIIWKIIQEFGHYLAAPIRDHFLNFTNFMVYEANQKSTRFKFCIAEATARFPRIAEAEFIKRYIDDEKLEGVKDIISNIKDQFIDRINAAEWMDEDTKEAGIYKVNNIVEIIGEHSLAYDENIIKDFLKLNNLEFTTDNIVDMIREKNKDTFERMFKLENTTQIDFLTNFFFSKTFHVNAAYMELANIIFLPSGIVLDVFHSSNRPNYLNYGALGSIIGHEIAHAFGHIATTHDSEEEKEILTDWFNGTLQRINELHFLNTTDLWQNDSLEALANAMECVVRDTELFRGTEYDQTIVAENFADLVGIDVAYEAYVAWAEQYEEEQQLPGLSYTPKQMFWVQFGTVNCFSGLDSVPWTIDKNTHSSMRYRVLNTLKNSENFARDFECPEASLMNPIEKCRVF